MSQLISNDDLPPEEVIEVVQLDFSMDTHEPELTKRPKKVEPPEKVEQDPPKPPVASSENPGVELGTEVLFKPPARTKPTAHTYSDGSAVPIVSVTPRYPERAKRRGLQGYVVVEFGISALGNVVNPTVIEAEPSNVFDRAALAAVARYKYKPSVANGEPVAVNGVLHRLVFELEDG
ncbi:MAG: energy transducer TonB [Pseudomonadaceae bacterium]|nr:energy transducer TonB [Pseudomonadaceae bacterium]